MMYFPDQKVAVAVQVNTSVGRSLGKPLGRVVVEAMEVIKANSTAIRATNAESVGELHPQKS